MSSPTTIRHATTPSIPRDRAMGEKPYVLGTGSDEMVRLGLQHRLWSAASHALWEKARVQPGSTVIDLGCGPGHATLDLAEIAGPEGRVIAVDESASFLRQLADLAAATRLHNIERVLGDVQKLESCVEDGAGTIDVAYARWVFCFVQDPEAVLRGVRPLLRTGGRIAIQDYFNYEFTMAMAPRNELFTRVVAAVSKSWRDRGGNPDVMGLLPGLLRKHGFQIRHMEVVQRIARPGTQMWHWPSTFFATYVPKLVESGHLSATDLREFQQLWARASQDPACFVQLPSVFELIAASDERLG